VSQLDTLVKSRLNAKPASVNRLTVRLDHEHHEKLKSMADAFTLSKTAFAEELLASAVDDAYKLYLDSLDPESAAEEQQDLDRAIDQAYYDDRDEMAIAIFDARTDARIQIDANDQAHQELAKRLISKGVEVVKE
jgi:hypothetical protein